MRYAIARHAESDRNSTTGRFGLQMRLASTFDDGVIPTAASNQVIRRIGGPRGSSRGDSLVVPFVAEIGSAANAGDARSGSYTAQKAIVLEDAESAARRVSHHAKPHVKKPERRRIAEAQGGAAP